MVTVIKHLQAPASSRRLLSDGNCPFPPRQLRKPPSPGAGKVTHEGPLCFILVLCFCLFKLPRSWAIAGERRRARPQSFAAALGSPGMGRFRVLVGFMVQLGLVMQWGMER